MAARPGRIANDWLAYIRPHLRPFEALEHGERGDYIAKLSKKVRLSDNTLRRFIAAAQFLEAEGITELAPDVRMPVAAVERVARIAARQPERRRKLLEDVSEGKLTIMELRELLKKCRKSAKRPGGAHSTSSLDRVARELEIRNICRRGEVVLARADEDEFGWLLTTLMKRSFIVRLPEARRALILDAMMSQGSGTSFAMQRRGFLRNVLVGASLYDFVFVFAAAWHYEVEKLVQQLRPVLRKSVILVDDNCSRRPPP
jgi:hypothetical protein